MREIRKYEDIPFEDLYSTSSPTLQAYIELQNKGIFEDIEDDFNIEGELEKAISGAFIGWHIINHLIQGGQDPGVVDSMLIEILGTYSEHDKDLEGPCWKTLKKVLSVFGFEDFYQKGLNYVIDNTGELD